MTESWIDFVSFFCNNLHLGPWFRSSDDFRQFFLYPRRYSKKNVNRRFFRQRCLKEDKVRSNVFLLFYSVDLLGDICVHDLIFWNKCPCQDHRRVLCCFVCIITILFVSERLLISNKCCHRLRQNRDKNFSCFYPFKEKYMRMTHKHPPLSHPFWLHPSSWIDAQRFRCSTTLVH